MHWATLPILLLIISCKVDTQLEDKTAPNMNQTPPHTIPSSIYGNITIQEITDSLWSDTTRFRDFLNPELVDSFYYNRILHLVTTILADSNDSSTLFPNKRFDKVIGIAAWPKWEDGNFTTQYGDTIVLTDSQSDSLLWIINNPLHFDWSECGTWTPSYEFQFIERNSPIETLKIGCGHQIKTENIKMKFGALNHTIDFVGFCNRLGLELRRE